MSARRLDSLLQNRGRPAPIAYGQRPCERVGEGPGIGVAVIGVLAHRALHHRVERRRHGHIALTGGQRLEMEHVVEDLGEVLTGERPLSDQCFVQDDPE